MEYGQVGDFGEDPRDASGGPDGPAGSSADIAGKRQHDFRSWDAFRLAQGSDYIHAVLRLGRILGFEFLGFVLACPNADVANAVPSTMQRAVVEDLDSELNQLQQIPDSDARRLRTVQRLCGYDSELSTSRATHWHSRCGGETPERSEIRSVENLLCVLVEDILGSLLIQPSSHISAVLGTHPAFGELMDALFEDPAEPLGDLFKNAVATAAEDVKQFLHTPLAASVDTVWTNTATNPVEYHQIPEALIANVRVDLYRPTHIIGAAQQAVLQNLSLAREIAKGEGIQVPTFVGLTGIELPEDIETVAHPSSGSAGNQRRSGQHARQVTTEMLPKPRRSSRWRSLSVVFPQCRSGVYIGSQLPG
jgi:hypothetical protein